MIHPFKTSSIKPHAQLRGSHPMTYPFPLSRIVLDGVVADKHSVLRNRSQLSQGERAPPMQDESEHRLGRGRLRRL